MDGNLERTAMLRLKRTAENLQKNGMETHILQRREEVVPWLKSFIPEGAAVAHGGSMTLSECGVIDLLKTGHYRYIDRDREGITPEERVEAMREALLSDVYLLSANALIENGMIYNVDGNGNRTAAPSTAPGRWFMSSARTSWCPTLTRRSAGSSGPHVPPIRCGSPARPTAPPRAFASPAIRGLPKGAAAAQSATNTS